MKKFKRIRRAFFPKGSMHRITNLLVSPRTKVAHIEFTSRCNLRCVFCMVSQPNYKGHDLDNNTLDGIIDALKQRDVKVVSVNGHGETTIYKNWHVYCDKLSAAGIPLHVISNFSKEFSEEEVETLSHFESIEVSCDSNDPKIFKRLRRGADLKTIVLNILRLRAKAYKDKRPAPRISLSCVVSDQNALNLKEYVAFGKALSADLINFCNLTKYPDIEGIQNTNHVTEMPPEQVLQVERIMQESFQFLKKEKIKYKVQQGLLDTLEEKIQVLNTQPAQPSNTEPKPEVTEVAVESEAEPLTDEMAIQTPPATSQPAAPPASLPEPQESQEPEVSDETNIDTEDNDTPPSEENSEPDRHRYATVRGEDTGKTRNCLDPWDFVLVQSNNEVLPCCWHEPLYTLTKYQGLEHAFNSSGFRELRESLLTGQLHPDCLDCPTKGWTTTDKLRKRVWKYINPGIHRFFVPNKPEMLLNELKPVHLEYTEGWHGQETNNDIPDPEWQSWRWTTQKAVCKTKNPKQESTLIIRGSVDKSLFTDQAVMLTVNGELMDKFVPSSAKFTKEYIIPQKVMGDDEYLTIQLETDKTFKPSQLDPSVNDDRELGMQVYQLFLGMNTTG